MFASKVVRPHREVLEMNFGVTETGQVESEQVSLRKMSFEGGDAGIMLDCFENYKIIKQARAAFMNLFKS